MTTITYRCYPTTEQPPDIAKPVARAFRAHEAAISTTELSREETLTSDGVLGTVRTDLEEAGFVIEAGKAAADQVYRPATFGADGEPDRRYAVDGYHEEADCVIEVEAGRAWDSNHVHRNLIRAMTSVGVETLVMAIPRKYKHANATTPAFARSREVAETLYRTRRVEVPFRLVLIGY